MKTPIVVCDLDETLASSENRYHKTPKDKEKATFEDWQKLMEGCENDPPISPMIGLIRVIHHMYNVVILTARDESLRAKTKKWLSKNGVFCEELIMRPDDLICAPWDYKRKEIAKLSLKYDVIAVIDDEIKTCEAANQLGILSLRVGR